MIIPLTAQLTLINSSTVATKVNYDQAQHLVNIKNFHGVIEYKGCVVCKDMTYNVLTRKDADLTKRMAFTTALNTLTK